MTRGDAADRIVDAARACIARVGVSKTTLDDVARAAGCSRATVYRYFPGKQPLVQAVVAADAAALQREVVAAAAGTATLAEAVTAVVLIGARVVSANPALAFVTAHEPELLMPYLTFEHEGVTLAAAAQLLAPAFTPFLPAPDADRLGEWVARIAVSYLCAPSERVDLTNPDDVGTLVEQFVLPGFAPMHSLEGIQS